MNRRHENEGGWEYGVVGAVFIAAMFGIAYFTSGSSGSGQRLPTSGVAPIPAPTIEALRASGGEVWCSRNNPVFARAFYNDLDKAERICMAESSGRTDVINLRDGDSTGLFQISPANHVIPDEFYDTPEAAAPGLNGSPSLRQIRDQYGLTCYEAGEEEQEIVSELCRQWFLDVVNNINYTAYVTEHGRDFRYWVTSEDWVGNN